MVINIVLGVFNLIPVPPLDGSHVVRHLLPAGMLRIYDTVGTFGLLLLVFWGGGLLSQLINPVFALFIRHPSENLMTSRSNQRKRVLSGMRSTGKLHLGNLCRRAGQLGAHAGPVRLLLLRGRLARAYHRLRRYLEDQRKLAGSSARLAGRRTRSRALHHVHPVACARSMPNCICCFP